MKLTIPCVIFAGGKSSRMHKDKSLLPFGKFDTLIEYQYRKLSALFEQVYISSKENKFSFTCELIKDNSSLFAPTAGFVALFEQLKCDRVFILSVDTPFITEEQIQSLLLNDNENVDATLAQTASTKHPMCGIYHRSLYPKFTTMLKEDRHKLGILLKESNTTWVMFDNEESFSNLNHPFEYEKAFNISQLTIVKECR